MATLKEFEEALRANGMTNALTILESLKKRDREQRSIAPARRVVGRKMTAELARSILEFHASTGMTQQEIAFKLGVNQGRVNEVIKRGKWLGTDPKASDLQSRDKALERLAQRAKARRSTAPMDAGRMSSPSPKAHQAVRPSAERVLPKREPVTGPLPLRMPEVVKTERPPITSRAQPTDAAPVTSRSPIVSAQLAFLDL